MANLYRYPFRPTRNSTEPSFTIAVSSTPSLTVLEVSGSRTWGEPTSRALRFTCPTDTDYYLKLGSSLIVAGTTDSPLLLGGTVEVLDAQGVTYVSVMCATSTGLNLNVTLGHGQ